MSGLELMPLLAIGSSVGGGVLSAYGSVMAGQETARAAEFEKQQLEIQAETAKTAALQAEAQRRTELASNIETIASIRAGRGVGSNSPTGQAIFTSFIEDEERNIRTERLNYLEKADMSRRAASMAGRKAKTSLLAGYLNAGSDILSSTSKAYSIYNYPATRKAG